MPKIWTAIRESEQAFTGQRKILSNLVNCLGQKADWSEFFSDILEVYSSLWSERAFREREKYSINHFDVWPALQIQTYETKAEFSVHARTVDPKSKDINIIEIKIMPGSGRSLTSTDKDFEGEPFVFYYDKKAKKIITKDDPRVQFHPREATKNYYSLFSDGKTYSLDFTLDDLEELFSEETKFSVLNKIGEDCLKCEGYFNTAQEVEGILVPEKDRLFDFEVVQSPPPGRCACY